MCDNNFVEFEKRILLPKIHRCLECFDTSCIIGKLIYDFLCECQ